MSKSLSTTLLFSLLFGLCVSTVFAQPPSRRSRQSGQFRSPRQADRLAEGDVAPDFTLKSPDGKRKITLSDYRGKKLVALVFGSYT